MAEMALSVVLSLPERMACRVPGTASSATSTLLAKVSARRDRKSTRLNSSHVSISYAVIHRYLLSFPTRRSSDLAHGLVRFWLIKLLDQSGPFLLRSLGNGRNGFVGGFELAGEDGLPCSGNSFLCDIHTFGKGFCTEHRASAHAILGCDAVASGAAGPFQLFILSNWWFRRRGNAARVCAAAGEFFGLILFAQDIIALLWRQVAAAQLVFADPDDRLMAVCKVLFQNGVLDFGV